PTPERRHQGATRPGTRGQDYRRRGGNRHRNAASETVKFRQGGNYFAASASRTIASTSGAEPNRTGSVAGSPVSSAARATASCACASLRSYVFRQIPITFVGRTGAAARS